ncbi:MAG: DUF4870 domain-containing protein [Candidatus Paceibacterota bacterium]|jgi:uncharacterized membrane protein|nr:hypothetical protein [Candidatus Paceibacterota bacterium]MDD3548445.1 hypothetical protein [Candidatus Paceibacterota bacterium]MDD4999290.1 hypothetical protein [Candidatus Paceibacterota bacterium]MDD5545383.1 hypothetical protein [Candidatus Paceibacterota bacterium]
MEENIQEGNNEQKAENQTAQKEEIKKVNPLAVLSYIGILFLIPLLTAKEDEFAKFHVKQGITLCIAEVITWAITMIPVIGWIIGWIMNIVWVVLSVMGIINVLKGEKKELPIIGKYASNWKI